MEMVPPEEIVGPLVFCGRLERPDVNTRRAHVAHDSSNRPVLPGGIHTLEDDQQRIGSRGKEQFLQIAKLLDERAELLFASILVKNLAALCFERGETQAVASVVFERVAH